MFFGLNAWQTLLWLAALLMIVAPFVVGIGNGLINGYFKTKDAHIGRIASAIGKSLSESFKSMTDILEAKMKNKGRDDA